VQGSMTVLPRIAEAVAGRARLILDGGILRGTDVVKALALGADAVAIGRLTGLALGAAGEDGLTRAVELLGDEIRTTLGLVGARSLAELTPDQVEAAPAVTEPHVFSALPLLPGRPDRYPG
ncbi:MAG TPA: alpha-hydroxy-acid oxidizing protein, partial [Alphaproteobacteria bacterium]|nr:alpha-hydroxy-acid oxidizing protein [Alphaproteobacteria bacterium]